MAKYEATCARCGTTITARLKKQLTLQQMNHEKECSQEDLNRKLRELQGR
jgi:hypothetical protein